MKKWDILKELGTNQLGGDAMVTLLLENRAIPPADAEQFLHPRDPLTLTASDVEIDAQALGIAIARIRKAIDGHESIVVHADYDADGVTAGTIMWETLRDLGASVMPYIPHRTEEGYGLSIKSIDTVKAQYNPTLIVTVDHGITAWENVAHAKDQGIEVIVTDHHVKPEKLPECTIVHTTKLCGAGVSWFVAKELLARSALPASANQQELLALAAIGTIADMVPLLGANRSIVKYGLKALNATSRVGLRALIEEAGFTVGEIRPYDISHGLAPRLNAMGRLVHAMDALRLLCTKQATPARALAQKLALTNKERQTLTQDMSVHAKEVAGKNIAQRNPKLLFVADASYNPGVIGLVAGKLVEEFYRPSIVLSCGETICKASARSVAGFNIVEAIRSCSDILVDVGGHPMAAGFTVETKNVELLQQRLEAIAQEQVSDDMLVRVLRVDAAIPLEMASESLWERLRDFEPFGLANAEPIFVTRGVTVQDKRLVGVEGKHLKLKLAHPSVSAALDAIAFGLGNLSGQLTTTPIDIAYSIDMNVWNEKKTLQLKVKDIHFSS
jgi:single-stranded-DNA-specific exonuclease